jgi:hypothetical protein
VLPDALIDQLGKRVYLNTVLSVEASALTYNCSHSGKKVSVSIVGDPTQAGPQANDGRISKQAGQCPACRPRQAAAHLRVILSAR